jgi:hypothetical protein
MRRNEVRLRCPAIIPERAADDLFDAALVEINARSKHAGKLAPSTPAAQAARDPRRFFWISAPLWLG